MLDLDGPYPGAYEPPEKRGIAMNPDVVVVGAGLVGAAIAYGLASRKVRVLAIDGSDRDFRAAKANFGLVWLHGKGMGMPAYHRLTSDALEVWPDFSAEITEATGIDLEYENNGGLTLCEGNAEFERRRMELLRLDRQINAAQPRWEMLDRDTLSKLLPRVQLGPNIVGASFGHGDGHCNPLRLLAALHAGILRKGGQLRAGTPVQSVKADLRGTFTLDLGSEKISAARVVIAAGLGTKALAEQVGLDIAIRPQRGQVLVTERLDPFLPFPAMGLRQTREGTVMIGAVQEDVGFDVSTTVDAAATLSAKAIRRIPALSRVRLVRQWAALRILTPDAYPIYAESQAHPGAFAAVCHSGVSLAALHATQLANAIATGLLPSSLNDFHHRRFAIPRAA